MIGYGIDITTKKLDELKIQESLIEKEALLGEIHHRVKNNLTLVLGLIEMQKDTLNDEKLAGQFIEIRNRIAAMSLIHDKMYRGESFANIDLNEYLTDLISAIAKFYSKDKAVKLIFELDKIFISSKSAVSLALLVNEVVTNAFKYAFKDIKVGVLKSTLTRDENNNILIISDNGNGLPEDFDIKNTKSLGFKLFNIFVKQLKGSFEYFNDNGLQFVIKWPIKKEV
jgi:two-component sensor histidine kinase